MLHLFTSIANETILDRFDAFQTKASLQKFISLFFNSWKKQNVWFILRKKFERIFLEKKTFQVEKSIFKGKTLKKKIDYQMITGNNQDRRNTTYRGGKLKYPEFVWVSNVTIYKWVSFFMKIYSKPVKKGTNRTTI